MVGVGEQTLCPREARDEIEIVARCPHGDRHRRAAETDLQGLLGRERVRAKRCDPVVEVEHLTPLRNPSHTTQRIRAEPGGRRANTQLDDAVGDVLATGQPLTGGPLLDGGVGNPDDGGVGTSDDGTPARYCTTRWNVDETPMLLVHFTSNTIWSAGPVAVIACQNDAL